MKLYCKMNEEARRLFNDGAKCIFNRVIRGYNRICAKDRHGISGIDDNESLARFTQGTRHKHATVESQMQCASANYVTTSATAISSQLVVFSRIPLISSSLRINKPYHLQVREVGRALGDHSWTLVPQRRLFRTADRGLIDVPLCVSSSRTVRTSSTYLEALEKCGLGCLSEPVPVRSLGFVVDIIAAFTQAESSHVLWRAGRTTPHKINRVRQGPSHRYTDIEPKIHNITSVWSARSITGRKNILSADWSCR